MGQQNIAFLAFNRGLVDPRGLARADIKRLAMSAETYLNFTPRVLGSMMLRAGLGYTGATYGNAASKNIPFIFSVEDTAGLEFTDSILRIWIDDVLLTRAAVTAAVAGGTFPSAASLAANWTDADEAGATSAWVSAGKVGFTGNGTALAIRKQTVAVTETGTEHALRVVVERGPIVLRVGSTDGDDDYISEAALGTGTHSLAFTPTTANFYIRFQSALERVVYLTSCTVEAVGAVTLPTPYQAADLDYIRHDQSGDVVFLACDGIQQRRIERRGTGRSWSIVLYDNQDGPFRVQNTGPITMTPSVLSGNGTLTASKAYFKAGHVGALFQVSSTGQDVAQSITSQNVFTDAIRVTGVDSSRVFTVGLTSISGTSTTATLQRSLTDSTGPWEDVESWTTDTTESYDDGLDNQIAWYRLGVKTGDYSSGTIAASLSYAIGTVTGVGRITAVTSSVLADIEVLADFGGTTATDTWAEGQWSDYRGWPSCLAFDEGRLWWFGKDKVNGSISDSFDSFDDAFEGDAGPISRSIGSGPVDTINWALALQRLVIGAQGAEFSCRSSSLDEPLTPTNFNLKPASTQGSAAVPGLRVDANGVFVQRGGIRVFELAIGQDTFDYQPTNLSAIVPRIGAPHIVRSAVQRQPDTRLHFIRSDGTAAVLIFDKVENVICWVEVDSPGAGGLIEDVMVLPGGVGDEEDQVYYWVKRTVNGATVRYREKFSLETECEGGTLNKQADSFIVFTNTVPSATVNVPHLIGEDVVVWADGKLMDAGDGVPVVFTVDGSGNISLTDDDDEYLATTGVVGLAYTAQWQSGKLLQLRSMQGIALPAHKNITGLGLILANAHARGLKYGRTFATADLNDMPSVEEGAIVDMNTVHTAYDQPPAVFPGTWSTDERLCLQAEAPKPVTVLAAICEVEMNE